MDKKANKNVQAAHIVPVAAKMPRYRPMNPAERDNYGNLVLLCSAHHLMVDKGAQAWDFTEEMLLGWKEEAEHELREKFEGIDRYSYAQIQDMIGLATAQGTDLVLSGIGELGSKVDSATAKVLTVLYEQFTDKHRDYEVAAMLNAASERFASGGFADTVDILEQTSRRLTDLEDYVVGFDVATRGLEEFRLDDFVAAVEQASSAVREIERARFGTSSGSQVFETQTQATFGQHENRFQYIGEPYLDRRNIFLWGLAVGVAMALALAWAVVWITRLA